MNILLLRAKDINKEGYARLNARQVKHILTVLKAEIGSCIRIGIDNLWVGTAVIISITPLSSAIESTKASCQHHVLVQLQHTHEPSGPFNMKAVRHRPSIDIIIAMPRPKTAAALGVGRIFVTPTFHVEGSYFSSSKLSTDGIMQELRLGLEQAAVDPLFPEVYVYASWKRFLREFSTNFFYTVANQHCNPCAIPSKLIVFHPTPTAPMLWSETLNLSSYCGLAIGPERGFTDTEIHDLKSVGFSICQLGDRILRVETALACAISEISMLLDKGKTLSSTSEFSRTDITPQCSLSCWCTTLNSEPELPKIILPIKGPDLRVKNH